MVFLVLYAFALYLVYKALDWIIRLPRVSHLDQYYYFITGCDSGFGHAIARRLDKQGCHVFAACLTEKGQAELRRSCSDRLVTVSLDVTDHESIIKAFQIVKASLPPDKGLSGLLNNAGIMNYGFIEWLQLKDYKKISAVNLWGLIDVTTTFLPLVKKARGRVVNTASVSGRCAFPVIAPYCITKHGVEAFSDSLRREMRPFNVSVHLIEPGAVRTNILDTQAMIRSLSAAWEQSTQDVRNDYGQHYFENACELLLKQMPLISSDMSGVVNAYEHALTGLFPRTRYIVGYDAKYFLLPLQSLPEWLGDWIWDKLEIYFGKVIPARASHD